MSVERPIRVISIFPTWTIHHCFNTEAQLENWVEEKDLNIISIIKCGEYLVVTAVDKKVVEVERIL